MTKEPVIKKNKKGGKEGTNYYGIDGIIGPFSEVSIKSNNIIFVDEPEGQRLISQHELGR